eukprot:c45563_g1_i1 orf=3-275(-)
MLSSAATGKTSSQPSGSKWTSSTKQYIAAIQLLSALPLHSKLPESVQYLSFRSLKSLLFAEDNLDPSFSARVLGLPLQTPPSAPRSGCFSN